MPNEIDTYINKQPSPQKEICFELRKIIFETFPKIEEKMLWGVPTFGSGMFYVVALKDHINLGFYIKNLTKEEITFFDGGGKTMKVIEIKTLKEIDKKRILKLLNLVYEKNR